MISKKGLTKDFINKYSIPNGKKYFSSDGLQSCLVLILTRRIYWISKNGSCSKIESGKSTGMSEKSIRNSHTSDIIFAPNLLGDYQLKKWNLKESVYNKMG